MRRAVLGALLCAALVATTRAGDEEKTTPPKQVNVPTEDGMVLAADLYEPTAGGEGKPAVVAIHADGGDRTMWKDIAPIFQRHGASLLAVDFRGHGGSKLQKGTDPKEGDAGVDLSARAAAHDLALFAAMWHDAAGAVRYLRATLLADGAKISIVGCGACGAAGLDAASRDAKIASALWIGPALNNYGAAGMEATRKWDGRPLGLMTTDKFGRTDFDAIAKTLGKQPRFDAITVAGAATSTAEIVSKGDGAKEEIAQFVFGWIERPKLTGRTHVEDNSGPGKIIAGQSSDGLGGCAGGLSITGNEAPPLMEGLVVLACAEPAAAKLPAGARRLTFRPAKGAEPCVDLTVEQWSGTGWSKVDSRTLFGCGAIVLGKDVNTFELWISPHLLGVKPFSELAVARAKIVKGKPDWSGELHLGKLGLGISAGTSKVDPANPSTWERQSLR